MKFMVSLLTKKSQIVFTVSDGKRLVSFAEKRKLEEQESEMSKKVKSEGDIPEQLIKQLVQQVELESANNENDVSVHFRNSQTATG